MNLEVSKEEVRNTMFFSPSTKSPKLDGFSLGFYKVAWTRVGKDLVKVVQEFFRNGKFYRR